MSLPKRKHPRLKQHDYSEPGAYFITVCTKNKAHILSRIAVDLPSSVGRDALIPPRVQLLPAGKIVDDLIRRTETVYDNVTVDAYVIICTFFFISMHPGTAAGWGHPALRFTKWFVPSKRGLHATSAIPSFKHPTTIMSYAGRGIMMKSSNTSKTIPPNGPTINSTLRTGRNTHEPLFY